MLNTPMKKHIAAELRAIRCAHTAYARGRRPMNRRLISFHLSSSAFFSAADSAAFFAKCNFLSTVALFGRVRLGISSIGCCGAVDGRKAFLSPRSEPRDGTSSSKGLPFPFSDFLSSDFGRCDLLILPNVLIARPLSVGS